MTKWNDCSKAKNNPVGSVSLGEICTHVDALNDGLELKRC